MAKQSYPVYAYGQVPLDVERERLEAFRKLAESARPARFVADAMIALAVALYEGHQWILEQRHSTSTSRGRTVFQILPERNDPSVDNVRVTLNRIRDLTEEVAALLRIDPRGWEGHFEPDRADPTGTHEQMRIERRIWHDYLQSFDLHTESTQMTEWRAQCGTGLLKAVPDQENPYGWTLASIPLDRVLWDSAVKTPNFALHRQWADVAAWAAEDVTRAYGIKFKEPERLPTLGALRGFETTLAGIRGDPLANQWDSKTPGVLLAEFYDDWSRRLTVVIHTGTGEGQGKVAWDGPNPYAACPLLHLNYGASLLMPIGVGTPIRIRPDQTILNLAMTSIVRHMLTSAGRWVVEKGSVHEPHSAFAPRVGSFIEWSPQRADRPIAPTLVQPMGPNAIAHQLAAALPDIMGEKIHIQPVMQGVTSPRGESRAAIVEKLAQAGRVYAAGAETDEDRIGRFLTHHARFVANRPNRRRIFRVAGPDLQASVLRRYEAVDAGRAEALVEANIRVALSPGAVQPPTRQEKEDRLFKAAASRLLSPEQLRMELYRQTGVPVTEEQEAAIANAAEENWRFMAGAVARADELTPPGQVVVDAKNYEPHEVHIFVHRIPIRDRHTMGTADAVVRELQWHIADHFDELGEERLQAAALEAEGQGMAGAVEQANANLLAETPLGGALAAPQPTAVEYDRRDLQQRAQEDLAPAM